MDCKGLAGLCTALSLSTSGYYKIELIEKRQDFRHQGATFALAPNGIKALEELFPGIVKDYLSKSGILMETGGYMLGWWDVRDELLRRVYKDNNITLRMGYQIEKIDDNPEEPEVKICFQNYNNLIISGKLLIAADGVHSMVREKIGLPKAEKVGTTVWRGNIDCQSSSWPGSRLSSLLDKGVVPMLYSCNKTIFMLFNFHPKKRGRLACKENALNIFTFVLNSSLFLLQGLYQPKRKEMVLMKLRILYFLILMIKKMKT